MREGEQVEVGRRRLGGTTSWAHHLVEVVGEVIMVSVWINAGWSTVVSKGRCWISGLDVVLGDASMSVHLDTDTHLLFVFGLPVQALFISTTGSPITYDTRSDDNALRNRLYHQVPPESAQLLNLHVLHCATSEHFIPRHALLRMHFHRPAAFHDANLCE